MDRTVSMTLLAAAAVLVVLIASPSAVAAPDPGSLVRAELLSDASAVKPGEPFTVGVALKLAPTWHVYWINPGETGLPTKVDFTLPQGWTASAVRFPVPKEFVQPGDIAGYGYEDEVVLLATITPAKDATVGSSQTISARVSWLVCDPNRCIPGKADVQTTVAVAEAPAANEASRATLQRWSDRVPVDATAAKDVAGVEWQPGDGEVAGTIDWKDQARDVELFPGEDDALEISDIEVEPASGGKQSRVAMRVRRLAGQTPRSDTLPAILAYTNAAGERRGIEVSIPLTAAAERNAQARRNE